MRFANTPRDDHWHPPEAVPATAPPRPRLLKRRAARPPSRAAGWLLALGLGAVVAVVAVAAWQDPRSVGNQLDSAVASVRGVGDQAGQSLADTRDAAAGTVDGIGAALTDTAISARIKAALAADPALKASLIDVTTTNGIVRLEGPAPDAIAKQRATMLVSAREGVRGVDNRLALPQPGQIVAVVNGTPQVAPAAPVVATPPPPMSTASATAP